MTEKTILCFGDSNTHGTRALKTLGDRERLPLAARWPSVMARHLGDDWTIIAEGLPGRTTVYEDPIEGAHMNGLAVLPALLASHRPLDIVIIMLGTNDTKPRFAASAFDISRGVERLAQLVQTSDAGPDAAPPALLIAAPVPLVEADVIKPVFEGSAAKSRALAPLLEEIAKRLHCGFLDLGGVAQVDPVDGVHLDETAHHAIGTAMARAAADLVSQEDRP
ncbi:MAG: SGNH/GDSL hydrolase family protein [Pseudomonadota bacterium]